MSFSSVIELTGDSTPDMRAIAKADVIVTTPEKWDGISRSWQNRSYVKAVALLVIDEIHLLGDERGPVLEVIVSRTNFISSHTDRSVRVVGLSTALANARDLADWLGISQVSTVKTDLHGQGLHYIFLVWVLGLVSLHQGSHKTGSMRASFYICMDPRDALQIRKCIFWEALCVKCTIFALTGSLTVRLTSDSHMF